MKQKPIVATALGAVGLLLLTACGAGGGGEDAGPTKPAADPSSCNNTVVNEEAELVTVWAWYPAFDLVVDEFNNTHDDVQVCWVNAGVGKEVYPKFSTALEAGSGAPDVIQLENEVIPSFTIRDGLVDLTEFGASDIEGDYAEGAWNDVSSGDSVFALPVDLGPVGMLYRADIFEQYGIEVPTTWDEFADASVQIREAGCDCYLTNYPTNGRSFSTSLFAQNGTQPFDFSTENVEEIGIGIDANSTAEVLDYWFGLIDSGVASADDRSTPEFNSAVVGGKYAVYLAAAWGPGYLQGLQDEADPNARWAAAPLPQWDADNPTYVNWGGSSFGVTSQARDTEAAFLVAKELFGTEDAWKIGIEQGALFPTWKPILESDYFTELEYPFFGGQKIMKDVFIEAAAAYQGSVFSPFQTYYYDKLTEAQFSVLQKERTIEEALAWLQGDLEQYAETQGFSIK